MQTITLNIPESLLIKRAISVEDLRRESHDSVVSCIK